MLGQVNVYHCGYAAVLLWFPGYPGSLIFCVVIHPLSVDEAAGAGTDVLFVSAAVAVVDAPVHGLASVRGFRRSFSLVDFGLSSWLLGFLFLVVGLLGNVTGLVICPAVTACPGLLQGFGFTVFFVASSCGGVESGFSGLSFFFVGDGGELVAFRRVMEGIVN